MLLFVLLSVDMGYYGFNRQHMDFAFLEYVGDLFAPAATTETTNAQALRKDKQAPSWRRVGSGQAGVVFLCIQAVAIGLWWWCYSALVVPVLFRWRPVSGIQANAILCACLIGGGAGFHPSETVWHSNRPHRQLGVLHAGSESALVRQRSITSRLGVEGVDGAADEQSDHAVRGGRSHGSGPVGIGRGVSRSTLSLRARHDDRGRQRSVVQAGQRDHPLSGRVGPPIPRADLRGVRGTPFLDRLKDDSVYFANFFSNGVQTSRGLFATLCSTYPRHGASAMKTRYAHEYLCLPSLLQRQGYSTEMVIGQHRDLNRLQTFLSRNGLQQMLDEGDFPPGAERAGLGIADGALFDLCYERIKQRQAEGKPFFLTTLTLSTHHPFAVPPHHDEVRTLQQHVSDQYVGALRYTDFELERVFTKLVREGLLRNTVVVIVGDHGRHESVGSTDVERKAGHFASPMLIWMDESLRTPTTYRPRAVSTIASHVDVAPTLLALNGAMPAMAPFVGHDLTCLLVQDCLPDQVAYLTSVYDNLVGLASRDGILLYSFLTERVQQASLTFELLPDEQEGLRTITAFRYRELLALYEVSNVALDSNRIWSWREFGPRL